MTDYEVTPPPDRLADRVQLRTVFSTERGEVTRFMIQLEYWLEGDWREVVRYDQYHRWTSSGRQSLVTRTRLETRAETPQAFAGGCPSAVPDRVGDSHDSVGYSFT